MKDRYIDDSSFDSIATAPRGLLISKVCALLLFSEEHLRLHGYSMLKEIRDASKIMEWTYVTKVATMAMAVLSQSHRTTQPSSALKDALELLLLLLNNLNHTKEDEMSDFLNRRYKEFVLTFKKVTTN